MIGLAPVEATALFNYSSFVSRFSFRFPTRLTRTYLKVICIGDQPMFSIDKDPIEASSSCDGLEYRYGRKPIKLD